VVLLFERVGTDDRAALEVIYGAQAEPEVAEESVAWVIGRMDELDVRGACEAMVRRYVDEATGRLRGIPFSDDARVQMEELIGFLARREK
jgi:geranylgeranyl pyrophosphate synthase